MPRTIEELKELEEQLVRIRHRLRGKEVRDKYCAKCGMTTPHEYVRPIWDCAVCFYLSEYLPGVDD